MKKFTGIEDVDHLQNWLDQALEIKKNPYAFQESGRNKTIALLFFNPSLRTRISTQRAAQNLGMNIITMDLNNDGWKIETASGIVMNQGNQEHIIEAAGTISQYCDLIGIRTFPTLTDKTADYGEHVLNQFIRYASVPVISLESATLHPLQSFADLITIEENKSKPKPKVVLTWAPHVRALPQSVPNSFAQWMSRANVDLVIANPKGFDLAPEFTEGIPATNDQDEALSEADFVYAKNWSSFENYGRTGEGFDSWMITEDKMKLTDNAKFMHCLPARRNVVVTDEVLDGDRSIVFQQAGNRIYAAQTAILRLLYSKKPAL